jgi:hypothetical protein
MEILYELLLMMSTCMQKFRTLSSIDIYKHFFVFVFLQLCTIKYYTSVSLVESIV